MPRRASNLVECPRCGYDQTGIIASFTDSCPLEGTCAECGLRFEWRHLINPDASIPRWSFEHTGVRFGRRLLATIGRSLCPWELWRSLRMGHPIRLGRLLIFAVAAAVLVHLGAVLLLAAAAIIDEWLLPRF